MTKSYRHEDLIDVISLAVNDMSLSTNWGCFVEHILAAIVIPELRNCGNIADSYIFTDDGYGPILLEVGSMKENKWELFTCVPKGNKVRVLRVDFDKNFYLRNARNTKKENKFLQFVGQRLSQP